MEEKNVVKENKMGTWPIPKLIITMSLPAMASMLVQALYNVVDSIFVANYSKDALAAVSLAFPLQMLLVAVAVGTGVGVSSLASRVLGAKEQRKADEVASHGLVLSLIGWVVSILIGLLFSKSYIALFTNDANIIKMGSEYLFIVFVFSIGAHVVTMIGKIIQSTGDMIYPMTTQLLGAVINIILDPIFIFGWFGLPKMGVMGAAIATVLGQIISAIYALYVLYNKQDKISVKLKGFKFNKNIISSIYVVALPSIVMQMIASVLITFLNKILAAYSLVAVSVLGIYYKLQSFVFMPVFGLSQGSMPIMGFNYGAKDKKRLHESINVSILIAFIIMFLGTILFWTCTKELLFLFNADVEMLSIGILALRVISLCFVFAGISITLSTFFQAIGQGIKSMIISILRQLGVILPCAYLLSKYFGLEAFWYSFIISEVISFIISVVWARHTLNKIDEYIGK